MKEKDVNQTRGRRERFFIATSLVVAFLAGAWVQNPYRLFSFFRAQGDPFLTMSFSIAPASPMVEQLAERRYGKVASLYPELPGAVVLGVAKWCEVLWSNQKQGPPNARAMLACVAGQIAEANRYLGPGEQAPGVTFETGHGNVGLLVAEVRP